MQRPYLLLVSILLASTSLVGQIGGRYMFEFLGSPPSARLSALGGSLINVADDDINLATGNPALLNAASHGQISFSHNFAFADISNGHIAYGHSLDSLGITLHGGISYVRFGEFTAADALGNAEGTFSGGESAVVIGASRSLNERMTLGVNIKGVFGNMELYSASAVGADVGLLYTRPGSNLNVAVVVKNIGIPITTYGDERAPLPLDFQIGISNRLEHLPFRFSIIAHQLQRWNIRYDDPDQVSEQSIFGEAPAETSAFNAAVDNFFRHMIFNGEFLIGKKEGLKLRFGYNHLRRREMQLSNFRSLAGFSGGFGIRVKGFDIDYGLGYFHLAGATNHLTLRTDLGRFFTRL